MPLFEIFIALLAVAMVCFQVWLTVNVFKSRLYEQKQKIWQAQLIWLLPIIGAGLVFTILQQDRKADEAATAHLGDGTPRT